MNQLKHEISRRNIIKSVSIFGLGSVAVGGGIAAISTDHYGKKGNKLSKEFEYNIQSLMQVDPDVIHFKESAPKISTGFSYPQSIAVDALDNIYVTSGQSVCVFNSNGKMLSTKIETEKTITSIFISNEGTIFIGAEDHIELFDLSGKKISQWQSVGPNVSINSIAVYQNSVFAADAGKKVIHRFDLSGNINESFGDFVIPSSYIDMEITLDGYIAVINSGKHRIELYSMDGNLMSWWGEFSMSDISGFCGCCNPVSLAVLPDGKGFITCEKGITRIKYYDSDGHFAGVVAAPDQFPMHDLSSLSPLTCFNPDGLDVVVDSQGRVLVLDPVPGEIRIFSRKESEVSVG